jgi:hypothetical protein
MLIAKRKPSIGTINIRIIYCNRIKEQDHFHMLPLGEAAAPFPFPFAVDEAAAGAGFLFEE